MNDNNNNPNFSRFPLKPRQEQSNNYDGRLPQQHSPEELTDVSPTDDHFNNMSQVEMMRSRVQREHILANHNDNRDYDGNEVNPNSLPISDDIVSTNDVNELPLPAVGEKVTLLETMDMVVSSETSSTRGGKIRIQENEQATARTFPADLTMFDIDLVAPNGLASLADNLPSKLKLHYEEAYVDDVLISNDRFGGNPNAINKVGGPNGENTETDFDIRRNLLREAVKQPNKYAIRVTIDIIGK